MASKKKLRSVGLARAMSKLGYCSRSAAAELIREGRVRLNGGVRRDPEAPVHLAQDRIEIDGKPLPQSAKIYVVLNKPRGVVTTAADEKGRQTVYDLLGKDLPWVGPVGRLDKASEGLLLLTNDSEWAARLLDPENHLDRTYHVQVDRLADEAFLRSLTRGVEVDARERRRARAAKILRAGKRNCWLEIVLDEGKNRQIRRILEHLGVEVLRLVRVSFGPLVLGDIPKGKFRHLREEEIAMLDGVITASA